MTVEYLYFVNVRKYDKKVLRILLNIYKINHLTDSVRKRFIEHS